MDTVNLQFVRQCLKIIEEKRKLKSVDIKPGSKAGSNYHGDLFEVNIEVENDDKTIQLFHWIVKSLKPDPGGYGNLTGAFSRENR